MLGQRDKALCKYAGIDTGDFLLKSGKGIDTSDKTSKNLEHPFAGDDIYDDLNAADLSHTLHELCACTILRKYTRKKKYLKLFFTRYLLFTSEWHRLELLYYLNPFTMTPVGTLLKATDTIPAAGKYRCVVCKLVVDVPAHIVAMNKTFFGIKVILGCYHRPFSRK